MAPQSSSGTILVVDDHSDSRAAVRQVLEELDFDVIEASNGKDALEILVGSPQRRVRLIVLDLQMPIMNGWEFLGLLRSYVRLSTIPVLVVSAYLPLPHEATHDAIVGCLQAPYEMDQLRAMVNACMSGGPGSSSAGSAGAGSASTKTSN